MLQFVGVSACSVCPLMCVKAFAHDLTLQLLAMADKLLFTASRKRNLLPMLHILLIETQELSRR